MNTGRKWRKKNDCQLLRDDLQPRGNCGLQPPPSAATRAAEDAWSYGTVLRDTNSVRAIGSENSESVSGSAAPTGRLPKQNNHFVIFVYIAQLEADKHMHAARAGRVQATEELKRTTNALPIGDAAEHAAIHILSQTSAPMSVRARHGWQSDADSYWLIDSAKKTADRSSGPDHPSSQEFAEKVSEFFAELAQKQEPLEADFQAIYFDNFDQLYED